MHGRLVPSKYGDGCANPLDVLGGGPNMNPRNRGVIIGLGGFFSGLFASRIVDWNTMPKAALTVGVALVVSLVLVYVVPLKKTSESVR